MEHITNPCTDMREINLPYEIPETDVSGVKIPSIEILYTNDLVLDSGTCTLDRIRIGNATITLNGKRIIHLDLLQTKIDEYVRISKSLKMDKLTIQSKYLNDIWYSMTVEEKNESLARLGNR